MTKHGIIFDFNGTLFWDSQKHECAWRFFAEKVCNRKISDEEFLTSVHGRTNRFILEYLMQRELSENEIETFSTEKESIYRELCKNDPEHFHLAPGAVELLDDLAHRGIPRTIATASQIENLEFYIESFGLDRWFEIDKIVYDDGSFPGKPAPDIYQIASERIACLPKDCVVVEDALSGIKSAKRAGIGSIFIIAPKGPKMGNQIMEEVDGVIKDFFLFDRTLFAERACSL